MLGFLCYSHFVCDNKQTTKKKIVKEEIKVAKEVAVNFCRKSWCKIGIL